MPSSLALALFFIAPILTVDCDRVAGQEDVNSEDEFCAKADVWDLLNLRKVLCTEAFRSAMKAEMRNECSTMLIDLMNPTSLCKLLDGKQMKLYWPAKVNSYVEAEIVIPNAKVCASMNEELTKRLLRRPLNRLALNQESIGAVHLYEEAVQAKNEAAIQEAKENLIQKRDALELKEPSAEVIDEYKRQYEYLHTSITDHPLLVASADPDSWDASVTPENEEATSKFLASRDELYAGCFPTERLGESSVEAIVGRRWGPFIEGQLAKYQELLAEFLQKTPVLAEVLVPEEGPDMLSVLLSDFKLPVRLVSVVPACAALPGFLTEWLKKPRQLMDMSAVIQNLEKVKPEDTKCTLSCQTAPSGFSLGCKVCNSPTSTSSPKLNPSMASQPTAGATSKIYSTAAWLTGSLVSRVADKVPQYVHLRLIRFLTKQGDAAGKDAGKLIELFSKDDYNILGTVMTSQLLTQILGGLMMEMKPTDVKPFGRKNVNERLDQTVESILNTVGNTMYVQCVL